MRKWYIPIVGVLGVLAFSPASAYHAQECVSPASYTAELKTNYPLALVNAMVEPGELLETLVTRFNNTPPLSVVLKPEDVDQAVVYRAPGKPMLLAVFFKEGCYVANFTFRQPGAPEERSA